RRGTHNYFIAPKHHSPNWIGWVKGLLVYPETSIEINQAELSTGNLLTTIRAGWQEFWGPKGRVEVGSSINLTSSSALLGRSINIYLYWGVGLFFFFFWAIKRSYAETAKLTLIVALGGWLFLAVNADLNYLGLFNANINKYFGKTLEQKHALVYDQAYYDFLSFAKEKLPVKPVRFGLFSSRYAPELAARIFLVPHILVDAKLESPEYLLVFQPSPEQQAEAKKRPLVAKLNEGAYITK
ncbi:MAG: hypothetical protein ABIA67_04780, partial [Candidatus Margulisiibacteriota bacterium]